MSLTHLWPIYLGAAALAAPVAIHFLTRPRPRSVAVSTLRFLRQVVDDRRARNRLRDALVLATRMLAIALLAAAIARPLIGERTLATTDDSAQRRRVVLLDVSQSLAAGAGGIQALERGRAKAAEYLAYAPGLAANLIIAAAQPRAVFEGPSTNFVALADELERTVVRPERLDVESALRLAGQMLAAKASPGTTLELVVVSDFQRANWAAADFSVVPRETQVQLESVAAKPAAANLAILRVGFDGRPTAGEDLRLEVEVGNFTPNTREVEVEAVVGDATYRLKGPCPSGQRTTLSRLIAAPPVGWPAGRARLVGVDDALEADNERPFVLAVGPPPEYLLVTAQAPGAELPSSFYLERALAPLAGRGRPAAAAGAGAVRRIETPQFDADRAAGVELLVLDHPGPLNAEQLQNVAGLLHRGRGVLYLLAEPLDATNLRRLADLEASNLQMPVEFAPPAAGQRRTNLYLAEVERSQSPFRLFGDSVLDHIAGLRFSGGLASRRLPGALADDLVASYSDRSAALVITNCAAGALAVWNVDLQNSNLPASAAFVPLVGELADRLVGTARHETSLDCGEPVAICLPAEAGSPEGIALESPVAGAPAGEVSSESLGTMWRASALDSPGVYRAVRGGTTVFALASQISAVESNLETLDPAVLKYRLAGGRDLVYHDADTPQPGTDDLWTYLALGVVLALLVEIALVGLFRT